MLSLTLMHPCLRLYACQVDISASKEATSVKALYGIDLPTAGSDGSCDVKVGSPLLVVLSEGFGVQSGDSQLRQLARIAKAAQYSATSRAPSHHRPPLLCTSPVPLVLADFPAAL